MRKKCAFWGAGKCGRKALDILKSYKDSDLDFKGFFDSYITGEYILSEKELDVVDCIIITVEMPVVVAEIYNRINNKDRIIYWFTGIKAFDSGDFIKDYCQICDDWGKVVLPQAEIHVADFCNLNCKGCIHFSALFEDKIPNTESRLKDIKKLSQKFTHIIKFFLLGGEPFLNPEVDLYINNTRKYLPNTMLYIVTNGLLIPKLEQKVFDSLRDNNFTVIISEYEPTHKIINAICDKLEQNKINYEIRSYEKTKTFCKPLTINPNTKYENTCICESCVNIYNNKVARCPALMYIEKFNDRFNVNLPEQGIFNLDEVTGNDILRLSKEKVALCDYCIKNEIKWERCSKDIVLSDFAELD